MPFGELDTKRSDRFGQLLRSIAESDLKTRETERQLQKGQAEKAQTGSYVDTYLKAIAPRQETFQRTSPMVGPLPENVTERPQIATGTETRMRGATPEELDTALREATLRLHAQGTETGKATGGALIELEKARKPDMSRTATEAYIWGTPTEQERAEAFTRLGQTPAKIENDKKIAEYASESGHKIFLWQRPDGTTYESPSAEKMPAGVAGQGKYGPVTTAQKLQIEKTITTLTQANVAAGNKMKVVDEGGQYTYIDENGDKHVITKGTPEANVFKTTLQNTIDENEKLLQHYNEMIGGMFSAGENTPARLMTKDEFTKDFKDKHGRNPDDFELDVAKEMGNWE